MAASGGGARHFFVDVDATRVGSGARTADLSRAVDRIEVGGWKVPAAYKDREIAVLAGDLDLEPVLSEDSGEEPHFVYDLTRLRERLEALDASELESIFTEDRREETLEDEVIFDTEIVHDRVSALA